MGHFQQWTQGLLQCVRRVAVRRAARSTGRVVTFAEPDYQYGVGPLTLRVEHVDCAHPMPYEGEDWFPVVGVQIDAKGTDKGRRRVVVRGTRLLR